MLFEDTGIFKHLGPVGVLRSLWVYPLQGLWEVAFPLWVLILLPFFLSDALRCTHAIRQCLITDPKVTKPSDHRLEPPRLRSGQSLPL